MPIKRDPIDVEMEQAVLRVREATFDAWNGTGLKGNKQYLEFVTRLALVFAQQAQAGARGIRMGE